MKRVFLLLLLIISSCALPPEFPYATISSHGTIAQPHPSSPWAAPSDYAAYHRSIGEPVAATVEDGNQTLMPSGDRIYRSRQSGRILGSASTSPSGNTTYRDSEGRITGNSSTSFSGRTTHRDGDGRISLTSDTDDSGTTTYRRDGLIIGQKQVSPAGNVTWRDGRGRIIPGPESFQP